MPLEPSDVDAVHREGAGEPVVTAQQLLMETPTEPAHRPRSGLFLFEFNRYTAATFRASAGNMG